MKREPLSHPRIFDTQDSAEYYYKENLKPAKKYSKEVVKKLTDLGFQEGRVLDAGCGYGLVSLEIARVFPEAKVVGVDLGEPLLEMARSSASDAGFSERVRFEKQNVESMPYPDDSFDAVVSIYMLHIVEKPKKMIEELERVLKSDGILYLRDLRRSWIGYLVRIIRTAYAEQEVKELLKGLDLRPYKLRSSLLHLELESGPLGS